MMDQASEVLNAFDGYDEAFFDDPRTSYPPIPKKLISTWIKRGVLSAPVTPEQDAALKFLQVAWGEQSKLLLRFLVSSVRKRDRGILLEYPLLGKIERFVLALFSGEKKRTPKEVKEMVFRSYGINYPISEIEAIRKLGYRRVSAKKEIGLKNNE